MHKPVNLQTQPYKHVCTYATNDSNYLITTHHMTTINESYTKNTISSSNL